MSDDGRTSTYSPSRHPLDAGPLTTATTIPRLDTASAQDKVICRDERSKPITYFAVGFADVKSEVYLSITKSALALLMVVLMLGLLLEQGVIISQGASAVLEVSTQHLGHVPRHDGDQHRPEELAAHACRR